MTKSRGTVTAALTPSFTAQFKPRLDPLHTPFVSGYTPKAATLFDF